MLLRAGGTRRQLALVFYDAGFALDFDGVTMRLPYCAGKTQGLGFPFWYRV